MARNTRPQSTPNSTPGLNLGALSSPANPSLSAGAASAATSAAALSTSTPSRATNPRGRPALNRTSSTPSNLVSPSPSLPTSAASTVSESAASALASLTGTPPANLNYLPIPQPGHPTYAHFMQIYQQYLEMYSSQYGNSRAGLSSISGLATGTATQAPAVRPVSTAAASIASTTATPASSAGGLGGAYGAYVAYQQQQTSQTQTPAGDSSQRNTRASTTPALSTGGAMSTLGVPVFSRQQQMFQQTPESLSLQGQTGAQAAGRAVTSIPTQNPSIQALAQAVLTKSTRSALTTQVQTQAPALASAVAAAASLPQTTESRIAAATAAMTTGTSASISATTVPKATPGIAKLQKNTPKVQRSSSLISVASSDDLTMTKRDDKSAESALGTSPSSDLASRLGSQSVTVGSTTSTTPLSKTPPDAQSTQARTLAELQRIQIEQLSNSPPLSKEALSDLVKQLGSDHWLEPEVEELFMDVSTAFLTEITEFACRLAKHRQSDTLQIRDAAIPLERDYNLKIPGFGVETKPTPNRRHPYLKQYAARVQAVRAAQREGAKLKDK